jgi:hypothetical protein
MGIARSTYYDAPKRAADDTALVEATEAAAALGIPAGTVRSRSYYALRALREWAGQAGMLQEVSR